MSTVPRPEYIVFHSHPEGLVIPPDMCDQLQSGTSVLGIEECALFSLQPEFFTGYPVDPNKRPAVFLLWGMRDRYSVAPPGVEVIECGGYTDASAYCRHKRPHALRREDGSEYTLWLDMDKAPAPEDGEPLPRYTAWPRTSAPWGVYDRYGNRYVEETGSPDVAEEMAQEWNTGGHHPF